LNIILKQKEHSIWGIHFSITMLENPEGRIVAYRKILKDESIIGIIKKGGKVIREGVSPLICLY
jgi:hypothetical protein